MIWVNGEARTWSGGTVEDLVREFAPSPRGIAVALDREVVARSRWSLTRVANGARVEIVSAAAGG